MGSGCARIYVFLTDGGATDSFGDFENIIISKKRPQDKFMIIGLGIPARDAATNKAIACRIGGVFINVPDRDEKALIESQ